MTTEAEPIRGRVARILNSREVALNVGFDAGVQLGMRFDVLDLTGEDIRDPDSDELLGSLQRAKVQLKVVRVEARLSVASTFRSKKVNIGGAGGHGMLGIQDLFRPEHWITEYETLKAEDHKSEDLGEQDSFVKIGDPVVQVFAQDDDDVNS